MPAPSFGYSNLKNIGTVITASGVYTTAEWTTGTNTAVLKLPANGNYIVAMVYNLAESTTEARSMYAQLQMRSNNKIFPFEKNSWTGWSFEGVTSGYDSRVGYEQTAIIIGAQAGDTVYPYIHTNKTNIRFNINICAIRV